MDGSGEVGLGGVRQGMAGTAWWGRAWCGLVRHGLAGEASSGGSGLGLVRLGRRVWVWRVVVRYGTVGLGLAVKVRHGKANS